MSKYNVGDWVYIPNAYEWKWEPYRSQIEEVEETKDGTVYYIRTCENDLMIFESCVKRPLCKFKEHEVFAADDLKGCQKYISEYYYDALCRGCKYDKVNGVIWDCHDCKNKENGVCKRTGIIVGKSYSKAKECCRFYEPTFPQNVRDYVSWECYEDILKNCEFNPNCVFHKKSCHRTCTYERYMNELIGIPVRFMNNKRKVRTVKILRKDWVNQTFPRETDDKKEIRCRLIEYDPELTPTGKRKKGALNFMGFDEPTWIEMIPVTETEGQDNEDGF